MTEEQLEENLAGIRKNILTIISNHQVTLSVCPAS